MKRFLLLLAMVPLLMFCNSNSTPTSISESKSEISMALEPIKIRTQKINDTTTRITVSWSLVEGASYYDVSVYTKPRNIKTEFFRILNPSTSYYVDVESSLLVEGMIIYAAVRTQGEMKRASITYTEIVEPPPPPPPPPPPTGSVDAPVFKEGDRILWDMRASIQSAPVGSATSLENYSDITKAAGDSDLNYIDRAHVALLPDGRKAIAFTWSGWNNVDADQSRQIRRYFESPKPLHVVISFKHRMGRVSTDDGTYAKGNVGEFYIDNPLSPTGNAGRKFALMARTVPDGGNLGRGSFSWPGPAPLDDILIHYEDLDQYPNNLVTKYEKLPAHIGTWDALVGSEHEFTIEYIIGSDVATVDGKMRIWLDGVLIADATLIAGTYPFDRISFPTIIRSPRVDQTEYFWDIFAWEPK